ncbi:MAG TPA: hypothetical protein VFL91_21295 [Thermomicrobiales bacterium]|nr:hypothetical protein [Thermomicrobiales bacterium]
MSLPDALRRVIVSVAQDHEDCAVTASCCCRFCGAACIDLADERGYDEVGRGLDAIYAAAGHEDGCAFIAARRFCNLPVE